MDHIKAILKLVAKYHAATAIIGKTEKSSLKRFLRKLCNKEQTSFDKFFEIVFSSTIEAVKTWPGFESIALKLEALAVNFKQICVDKVFERDEDGFNVLLHGDLWSNNIMYQYDSNNCIKDVKMVKKKKTFNFLKLINQLLFMIF